MTRNKKNSFVRFLTIFALALLIGFTTYQSSEAASKKSDAYATPKKISPQWSYSGKGGPSHWGSLKAEYTACGKGKRQSPIDISNASKAELGQLHFKYRKSLSLTILNNGHVIQINQRKGSVLHLDGTEYGLLQIHFHSPSEHTIDNKSYPMEAHFVHSDKDGNLAVVGVMISVGSHNAALDTIWPVLPKTKSKEKLNIKYEIAKLLPADKSYYRYAGSLTTPPCTESVTWLVLKDSIEISKDQLKSYRNIFHKTNRPIQKRNNRLILN